VAVPVRVGVPFVVLPTVVLGRDAFEHAIEVRVAPGFVLNRGDATGRVRDEDGAEPVTAPGVRDALLCEPGDVMNFAVTRGLQREVLVPGPHRVFRGRHGGDCR